MSNFMFKKIILAAIATLCIGFIGCGEINEPIVKNTVYSVVTIHGVPVDELAEREWDWGLRMLYIGNNAKIDKVVFNYLGELMPTSNSKNNITYFKLQEKYYPTEYVYVKKSEISGDTLKGEYWFGGYIIDCGAQDFTAVRGTKR
jgi:hypothetical protein